MSRILEFQHADEQTVVARVLLELHQAIDLQFPEAKGSSRQFSKTVLATQTDGTAIDNQAVVSGGNAATAIATPAKNYSKPPKSKNSGFGIEFSKSNTMLDNLTATMMHEASWSKWLTRILFLALFVGTVLLAWIYLFGVPRL